MTIKLNREAILQFMPHRPPFLFIDSAEIMLPSDFEKIEGKGRVNLKAIENVKITSFLHVHKDWNMFQGHFPGNPILPGVIQVEIMAQASLCATCCVMKDSAKRINMLFTRISNAKFKKPILPGMDVRAEVICSRVKGHFLFSKGLLMVEARNVAECEIVGFIEIAKGGPS